MKFLPFLLLIITVLTWSCKDKKMADCGCDSPTIRTVENVKASYLESKKLLLQLKSDDLIFEEVYEPCFNPDTLTVTPDIRKPSYIVSGNVRTGCITNSRISVAPLSLEITTIKKIL